MRIIATGLANNKTSLGEVFRRNVECLRQDHEVDVYDLSAFVKNKEAFIQYREQYRGPIDHDIRYFHTTFDMWCEMKRKSNPKIQLSSKKIGYFVWESSELPLQFQRALHDFDEIWTASQHCKDVFSQYYPVYKIRIVPHPIPRCTAASKFDKFTILVIGNLSSNDQRKNIFNTLKTALEFATDKDIQVIFKTTCISNQERALIKQVDNQKLVVIDDYRSTEQTQELISRCHVILSLHRCEGFGLTLAEAMANEVLVVATGYSGNMQFMNTKNSILIDYDIISTNDEYFCGSWAEPNYSDAYARLMHVWQNYVSYDAMIKQAKEDISNLYPDKIAAILSSALIKPAPGDYPILEKWYPTVSTGECISYSRSCNSDMFAIADIIPQYSKQNEKCLSSCLFFKPTATWQRKHEVHANNSYTMEDLNLQGTLLNRKPTDTFMSFYIQPLFEHALEQQKHGWDMRVYLANDLQCLIPFFRERNVEVVLMRQSSICHNPGAMWRYLEFDCKFNKYEISYIKDSDSKFQDVSQSSFVAALLNQIKSQQVALARGIQITNKANESAIILGEQLMVNPYLVNLDMVKIMNGFIQINVDGKDSSIIKPHQTTEERKLTNAKRLRGLAYPNYGFDEAFLKHVIYWNLTERRLLGTVAKKHLINPADVLQCADLEMQYQHSCRVDIL